MTILPAGLALGAALGAFSKPDMKEAPAPWWRLTGAEVDVASADSGMFVEAWPEDLNPTGYRPDLDYDAEVWSAPIPAWDVEAIVYEAEPLPPDDLPPVTYGHSVSEQAADRAESAAQDAFAAQSPESEPAAPLPAGESAKSDLVLAGLY